MQGSRGVGGKQRQGVNRRLKVVGEGFGKLPIVRHAAPKHIRRRYASVVHGRKDSARCPARKGRTAKASAVLPCRGATASSTALCIMCWLEPQTISCNRCSAQSSQFQRTTASLAVQPQRTGASTATANPDTPRPQSRESAAPPPRLDSAVPLRPLDEQPRFPHPPMGSWRPQWMKGAWQSVRTARGA